MEATPGPRRYATTSTDWEFHRSAIADLYVKQNMSLAHVMKIMEQKYGFFATPSMYKKRITHWGLKKNLSKKEVAAMLSLQQTRREEGKQTDFFVGQRKVDLDKYLKRREPISPLSSHLAPPTFLQSDIIARTPSPDSTFRKDPATLQLAHEVSRILAEYVHSSFNTHRWSYTYNLGFSVTSMQDPSDFALNNARRTFALVKRILENDPQETTVVLLLLRSAFDKLTLIVKNESPMLVVFLLELCESLKKRSDLATTIQPRLYQLCENALQPDHALVLILRKIGQVEVNHVRLFTDTVYDTLLDTITPFVGPDNLLSIRLYLASIWHSEGVTGFSREQPHPLIRKHMLNGRTQVDFSRSKCALALGLCNSSFQNATTSVDAEQYLDTISSTFKLLEALVDYSQAFSVLLLANLNLDQESQGEENAIYRSDYTSDRENAKIRSLAHKEDSRSGILEQHPRDMSSIMSLSAILEPVNPAVFSNESVTPSSVASYRSRQKYELMVVCTLQIEVDAILDVIDEFLDEEYETSGVQTKNEDACTIYTGIIEGYHIVFVHLRSLDSAVSKAVVNDIQARFSDVRLVLQVGLCGGTPKTALGDVVFGDTVVRYKQDSHGEVVIQNKHTFDDQIGHSEADATSNMMVSVLRTHVMQNRLQFDIAELIHTIQHDLPDTRYPGSEKDRLYESSYLHKHSDDRSGTKCEICSDAADRVCKAALTMDCDRLGCEGTSLVIRDQERSDQHLPRVHFGRIASGNRAIRSGHERDYLAKKLDVLAFEMEGAGIWPKLPTIAIKGVCDYSDGHKTKVWRRYAATTAAVVMKSFLKTWSSKDLQELRDGTD